MNTGAARGLLLVVFAALLAAPVVYRYVSTSDRTNAMDARAALERYGFYLEEVSEEVGIDFTHRAPTFDEQLAHIMPQIASMGASVSVVDFDRDGWSDLYVTNSRYGSPNALYRNLRDPETKFSARGGKIDRREITQKESRPGQALNFENVAEEVGLAAVNRPGTGVSMGSVWGDYDNDGYEDLFLYKWGRVELFHNDGGEGFTRVTEKAGLPDWAYVNTATWFDYDRDGYLDLFFGGYYREDVNLWDLSTTEIMPESWEYAQNGGRKYLLRGNGDGTFEDVSELLGPDTHRWMMAVSAADLNGDGWPDLYVANDYGVDELYLNEHGRGFRPVGEATGIGFSPKSGMNVAFGDVLNRGRLSIYVTNISEPGVLLQGNNLWVPASATASGALRYQNLAGAMGVERGGWSYGAQFGDLNNDGALDLFLVNGYVSAEKGTNYWYDFSMIAGGHSAIISDAKNWPAMEGRSLSGYQRDRLWLNDGAGRFREVGQAVGVRQRYDGRAVALVDLWNRGVLDVVVANQGGPLLVYKNTVVPSRHWIGFKLMGTRSNRSAIGAQVELFWNGRQQVQTVLGASGFSAQNQRSLHFGLGEDPRVEKAVIHWPSGTVQTLTAPEIDQLHTVREPR